MAYNYNINGNGQTKNSVINKHKGEGMEEKVVVEFINDMKQERKSDKFYIHFHDYSTYRDRCWYKSI